MALPWPFCQVPYGDNFYSALRHTVSYVSPKETKVKVCAEIRYRKGTPWSLTRTLIEKNSYSGLRSYWEHVGKELQARIAAAPEAELFAMPEQADEPATEETIAIGNDSVLRHSRRPSLVSARAVGAGPVGAISTPIDAVVSAIREA